MRCDRTLKDLSSACLNRKTSKSSAFEYKTHSVRNKPYKKTSVYGESVVKGHHIHHPNHLVCCSETKCCPSQFFITAMSLYTGTTVTPDESWQCCQTIGGLARICPFSRPTASSHLCNGCFYWWNRVTWEQLVIYNAHIACLGASEAEDVGRTVRMRAQCLTPIFTEPCSDRLLSTACWAASASISVQTKDFFVYIYMYIHILYMQLIWFAICSFSKTLKNVS